MNNISACGKTDIGLKRSRNDDSFLIEEGLGLFIVADGMGGHPGGDVASRTAVETAADFAQKAILDSGITMPFGVDPSLTHSVNILSSGIRLANRRIFDESKGMGTTMAALLVRDGKAYICHVGDSRVYRIRNRTIEQLTEDHSLVAGEIKRGTLTEEQARSYRLRHVITRAVGTAPDVECDSRVEDLTHGDIFLLCSDGLSGMLKDPQILEVIETGTDPAHSCNKLIDCALAMGGDDNITVVVVQYMGP